MLLLVIGAGNNVGQLQVCSYRECYYAPPLTGGALSDDAV